MPNVGGSSSVDIDPAVWRIGAVTVLGSVMSVLDTTIVNVALDSLSRDLSSPLSDVQWVVTAYLLAIAVAVPCSGWAARTFGTRRVYLASLWVFVLGSLLCALAWSTPALIAARAVQGIGGGMLLPVGQMITVRNAGERHLGRVMGVLAVPTVVAPVFGPTVGGVLIEQVGWRAIFLINLPIGALALAAGLRLLPRDRPTGRTSLDVRGLLLLVPGLALLTLALSEGGSAADLLAPLTVGLLLAGLLLVVGFVVHAAGASTPLLDVRLFRAPAYAAVGLATFTTGTVILGGLILLPLYFQGARGEGPMDTGILMAPTAIGVVLVLRWAGRTADRVGGGVVALAGAVVLAVGTVPFLFLGEATPYWPLMLGMLVRGVGVGLVGTPLTAAALRALDRGSVSDGSAQLNVLQRVGGSIGTAAVIVLLERHATGPGGLGAAGDAEAFGWTFRWVLLMTLLSLIPISFLAVVERRAKRAAREPEARDEPPVPTPSPASAGG